MPDELAAAAWSLGLGLLVGLQRERAASPLAGVRTFPLVTLLGTVCAWLGRAWGGWAVAAGLLALAAVVVMANVLRSPGTPRDGGMTTEVATLLMFGVGAYLPGGDPRVAMVVSAVTAVLLHLKPQLHAMVRRLGDHDLRAIMQFVVIALVVLPILPDRTFGPFDVLNPHRAWWMVVLLTGISLAGYLVHKGVGERAGIIAGGILGGLVSSTATAFAQARNARAAPAAAPAAAAVVILASAVVFVRVGVLVWLTDAVHASEYLAALGVLFAVLVGCAAWSWLRRGDPRASVALPANPAELRSALAFAAIYAAVLLACAYARERHGNRGLLVVSAISGLTDMDAITVSAAQMSSSGDIRPGEALRAILVAATANLAFKAGVAGLLGGRRMLGLVGGAFAVAAAVAVAWALGAP